MTAPSSSAPSTLVEDLAPAPVESATAGRSFHLLYCLGRGGFGEVYRARIKSSGGLEFDAAVKVLHGGLGERTQSVERLRDEGRLIARLDHPTILRAHDLVVLEGRVGLITEYVDGQDLGDCLRDPNEPLGVRGLVQAVEAVADALDAAFNAPMADVGPLRLVHRDIKPSNLRLTRHGTMKVLDFGIARSTAMDREAHTGTSAMIGSVPYMSPERFVEREAGAASDVFALGCVLYEGVAGERLLEGLTLLQLMSLSNSEERFSAHIRGRLRLISGQPAELMAVLEETTAWDPKQRPTARALAQRLAALAADLRGPTLREWARERTWPSPSMLEGPLAGREFFERSASVVVSGTIDASPKQEAPRVTKPTVREPPAVESSTIALPEVGPEPSVEAGRPRRAGLWALGGAMGGMAVGAIIGGLLFVVIVAAAVIPWGYSTNWWGLADPVVVAELPPAVIEPAPPVAEEIEEPQPPEETPPVTTQPEVAKAKVTPKAESKTIVITHEVEPPKEEPPPGVEAAPTGDVSWSGKIPILLRRGGDTFGQGPVAPGDYEVLGNFGKGHVLAGKVSVNAGDRLVITCSPVNQVCNVQR